MKLINRKVVQISGVTISDLFFNSEEAKDIQWEEGHPINLPEQVDLFRANYPELGAQVSTPELTEDYRRRV